MRNFKKKINRIAPALISAAMLITLSVAVYGLDGGYGTNIWQPPIRTSDSETEEEPEPVDTTTEESEDTEETEETTTTTSFHFPPPTTPPVTTPEPWVTTTTSPPPQITTTPDVTSSDLTTTPRFTLPPQFTTTPTETEPPVITDDTTTGESDTTEPPVVVAPEMYISFTERWLTVGDGVQLTAQVLNTEEYYPVSFSSSDTSVVRVDASGYIIAVGAGSAVVTAYSGELAAYAAIYVSQPEAVPEFLILNENSFLLKIDQTVQIQARLLPEETAAGYTISYVSNDPSIASVDENGVITAISEGATTITVSGAGLQETVQVTVSSDVAYDTARLDGYLYDGGGQPMSGIHLVIDELSAVTDRNGYFVFESVEQRSLTIRLADDRNAACGLTVNGNTTVYLLYDGGALTRMSSYEELEGRLAINSVKFVSTDIVLTEGEVYELIYQYEPSNASITGISYSSSNTVAATVGQLDGVVTAKSPGEATITLTLNNGQAEAICTITVNPKESSEYSMIIIIIEGVIFASAAAVILVSYRKYKARTVDDDEEEDLHDID